MLRVSSVKPCKIVYSLFEHEYLGYLFEPHIVQLNESGEFSLVHQRLFSHTASEFDQYLDDKDLKIIRLLDQCEQEHIIKKYFKKAIRPSVFFPAHYDEKMHADIRPRIEKKLAEAIDLMQEKDVFETDKEGNPTWKRLKIAEAPATVLFHFRRNEGGTRYFPTIKHGNSRVDFMFREALIICNFPAKMLVNGMLYRFEGPLEGKKLQPFLNKRYIEIPESSEHTYFEKFVAPLIEKHHVYAEGFDIITERHEAVPVLKIPAENYPGGLVLHFRYNRFLFPFSGNQVSVKVNRNNGSYRFYRIKRSLQWEQKKAEELVKMGLQQHGATFCLKDADFYQLIHWLNEHTAFLKESGFLIEQENNGRELVIGKSLINLEFKENNDWFDIHAKVKFGEYEIPFLQLKQHILNRIREFELPDGKIAIIPESWFSDYSNLYALAEGSSSPRLKKHHVGLVQDYAGNNLAAVTIDRKLQNLASFEKIEEIPPPLGFHGQLRSYQQAGYDWFNFLREFNFGGCLADDMGLGKTVQALALLEKVREENDHRLTSLIVMPTSLIDNWQSEAGKFTPALNIYVHTGTDRVKDVGYYSEFDVVLSTYGVVRQDISLLEKFYFHYVILDESQNIKNYASKSARAVKSLKSKYRLILTGTPIENSVSELWSQLSFANPGLLGSYAYFQKEFQAPIEKQNDEQKLRRLQNLVKPFILRRTKDQVARELPPKTEQVFYCNMTPEQETYYEETKSYYRNELLQLIATRGISRSQVPILQGLGKLRQIANHPALVDENYRDGSWKFNLVQELLQSVTSKGHKILVFSQFVKHLSLFRETLGEKDIPYAYLDGSTKKRGSVVDQFRNNEEIKAFLISIKAGGTGLNLTEADYVFILDPWWNPAVEQQAIDRSHRIGQTKNVFIYKFITKNTVEEKILALQEKKRQLASSLITLEDSFVKSLTEEDIRTILE
ncbi:helicase-like protein [Anseongella ginsenosidimutans]|uniref:Helicase-like protein n=1 Tax=Anseongella ginsenosidimutans TaxID=496056 RepID=A0A4R3KUQ0_9SPHI|nr:DEAD/DEAH box helicase [Anseongella ginsenosidimutans]QEC51675.1 DEAD/DEAH box helicase [Anseongella ginsenosidimutans]TCS89025.1 helicase-like protein [Anseongella ginsenosidimutans]